MSNVQRLKTRCPYCAKPEGAFPKHRHEDAGKALFHGSGDLNANWRRGDQYPAISDFTEAIRFDPNNAGAYHDRGTVYYFEGKFHNAISDYSQAIRLDAHYAAGQ